MRHKPSIGEYLAFLSVKYEIDPEDFLYALRSAEEHKSNCGNLSIQCRGKIKTKLIFLVMRASEVIAQFRVERDFLLIKSNHLRNFMDTDRIRRYLVRKARTAIANSIKDLRKGMRHVNLKVKILEVAEPKHVFTRYGNRAAVAKASIADETGTIKLCLWNAQIDSVSAGDIVQIEDARVGAFRGESQLSLGKKGTLNVESFKPPVTSMDLPTPKI
ncbi:hypothetical protein KAS24_01520 [Candidatus Bathyarchaeota archaeon]|nr:hypothetical protein [Candidatus Bathyarchaeota archaeon]